MPLIPAFSASQPVGEPSVVTLTDTSTGSDVLITVRRVYLRKSDGSFLVPTGTSTDYIVWALADASIDIDCLTKDRGLAITVEWRDSSSVLYSKEGSEGFTSYNEDFDYNQTTILASNPQLINDNSFRNNKSSLRTYIDSGDKAISRYGDIVSAQLCYDLATEIRLQSVYYFNESTALNDNNRNTFIS